VRLARTFLDLPDAVPRTSLESPRVSFSLAEGCFFAGRNSVANLASWVTGTEGSNPSLSAKLQYFLASNVMVKPVSKRLR